METKAQDATATTKKAGAIHLHAHPANFTTACHKDVSDPRYTLTTVWAEVTCKRCLARMAK